MTIEIYVGMNVHDQRRYDTVVVDKSKPLPKRSYGWNAEANLTARQEYQTHYHDGINFAVLVDLVAEKANSEVVCLNNSIPQRYSRREKDRLSEADFNELRFVLNLDDTMKY